MVKYKLKLKEESCTGTGSSFSSGEGEQFGSNGGYLPFGGTTDKKKKKKKSSIKENISFTPEKRLADYNKYLDEAKKAKSDVERIVNIFEGFNIGELLNDLDKLKKFIGSTEKIHEKYEKISGQLEDNAYDFGEEDDLDNEKKLKDLSDIYYKLYRTVYELTDAAETIYDNFKKIKEKDEY